MLLIQNGMCEFQIPVFVGCNEPLLGDKKPRSNYHGSDGFGDAPDPDAPHAKLLQKEHAVTALVRMAEEHKGNLGSLIKYFYWFLRYDTHRMCH